MAALFLLPGGREGKSKQKLHSSVALERTNAAKRGKRAEMANDPLSKPAHKLGMQRETLAH